jgi:hypothetical protein
MNGMAGAGLATDHDSGTSVDPALLPASLLDILRRLPALEGGLTTPADVEKALHNIAMLLQPPTPATSTAAALTVPASRGVTTAMPAATLTGTSVSQTGPYPGNSVSSSYPPFSQQSTVAAYYQQQQPQAQGAKRPAALMTGGPTLLDASDVYRQRRAKVELPQ